MTRGALEGERTLSMMVPALIAQRGASGWSGVGNWKGTGTSDILMFSAYIDTSGYTADDLTLFPLGVILQDPGRYISSNAVVPLQIVDIITTEVLSLTDVYDWIAATPSGGNAMPGMLGTTHDWMQVTWGQYRTFLPQATFTGFATEFLAANGALFGSGEATTADKLHCYRIAIMPGSAEGDTLAIPASRFILSAVIVPEDEKAFLMRQKRSYELAT